MKKLIDFIAFGILVLTLGGCGAATESGSSPESSSSTSSTTQTTQTATNSNTTQNTTTASTTTVSTTDENATTTTPENSEPTVPTAKAGDDQGVRINRLVTLDGSASSDPNGDSLTYSWSFISVPSGSSAFLNNSNTQSPSFIPDPTGQYTVQLIVNDGDTDSEADTVVINASENLATLSWGSVIAADLSGYKVYYGKSVVNITDNSTATDANTTTAIISGLDNSIYYFTVIAFDTALNESTYSNTVTKDFSN